MWGFLLGTACLIGLAKTARCGYGYGGRGYGRWGGHCGPRFGRWRHHGWHGGWHHGNGHSPRRMLRFLFERLETSPGQEKVIVEAVEAVRAAASKFEGTFARVRRAGASAMGGEHFDPGPLREVFTAHDEQLHAVREALVGGLAKIHEALDERQRRQLAELVEEFGGWNHC